MRKRLITLSASKLRRQYNTFENYVSQEKFRTPTEGLYAKIDLSESKDQERLPRRRMSIVTSAKKLETITPVKRNTKVSQQTASVSRLHIGAIEDTTVSKVHLSKKISFEYSDDGDFKKFLHSMKKCQTLERELQMNYDVSKTSRAFADISLGLYFQIDEELKRLNNASMKDFNSLMLLESLGKYTTFIREILRILRYKNLDDEATALEYLWRVNIKLIDTALIAHESQAGTALDRLRENSRFVIEKYREEMNVLKEKHEQTEKNLKEKVEMLQQKYKVSIQESRLLEEKLNQKEGILQELNEIDRFEVLRDTSKTLFNLSVLLEEVTEEKSLQVQLMNDITSPKSKPFG